MKFVKSRWLAYIGLCCFAAVGGLSGCASDEWSQDTTVTAFSEGHSKNADAAPDMGWNGTLTAKDGCVIATYPQEKPMVAVFHVKAEPVITPDGKRGIRIPGGKVLPFGKEYRSRALPTPVADYSKEGEYANLKRCADKIGADDVIYIFDIPEASSGK